MWEDMGVKDQSALDRADWAYGKWARKRLKDGTLLGWIAEGKGGVVAGGGCLWMQPVQPRPGYAIGIQPYLLSMYTEPGFRGKGVAFLIVEEAANWTRKRGYPSLRLHASGMGRGLYRKLGFQRAWEMKLEFGRQYPRRGTRTRSH